VALTDDQKAMLRLLAQREEGYEDMAALMGVSVAELRERVKETLAEVEAPADAPRPAEQAPPPAPVAPQAEPPTAAAPPLPDPKPAKEPAPRVRSERRTTPLPRPKLPKDRGVLIGLGAGAAVVLLLIVVLIVGGGEKDSGSQGASGSDGLAGSVAENPNLTQAVLLPIDGGDASGRALFGRFRQNILLQVEAEGLGPSPQGSSYAVWLSRGSKPVVPIGTGKVDPSGELVGRFPLPEAVLVLIARNALDAVDVTLASDSRLSAAVAQSRRSGKMPTYTGTPVMRGEIAGALVGAAAKAGR
jgi:hypothetical protein